MKTFGSKKRPAPTAARPSALKAGAKASPKAADKGGEASDGLVRLSKRMSELGLASRREADAYIEKGWVLVDGRVAELGQKVGPQARIELRAQAERAQSRRVTVLLNKPVGYVSGQAEDGYKPAKTLITPQNRWEADDSGVRWSPEHLKSLVPAGRLDIDSVGLLVLTQDGRVAKTIINEDSTIDKEYIVRVADAVSGGAPVFAPKTIALLCHGLSLDDKPLLPALVEPLNDDELRFVLKEGKKRQIRRMCAAVGFKVLRLKRVRVGRVRLGALPAGKWRYLKDNERF